MHGYHNSQNNCSVLSKKQIIDLEFIVKSSSVNNQTKGVNSYK